VAKSLVIVESPAKAKTINKFLGNDYVVKASMGHVRDLPKSKLGVDEENDFKPQYILLPTKKKTIEDLKKAAEKAEKIYLAADPDREGEAICWHLSEVLKGGKRRFYRVLFNEITKKAVVHAFDSPGEVDGRKVDAQQARRILDRLVGYKLSPLLWDKVRRGLSAGRVQSVALRIIVDREREIQAFKSEEYWSIVARLAPESGAAGSSFDAKLIGRISGRAEEAKLRAPKIEIGCDADARTILRDLGVDEAKIPSLIAEGAATRQLTLESERGRIAAPSAMRLGIFASSTPRSRRMVRASASHPISIFGDRKSVV